MEVRVPIHLAVEDALSEAVARKILLQSGRAYDIGYCFRRGGFGYLKTKITGFNEAAKVIPFFVLTDLDQHVCPPDMIADWMRVPKHPNLLFRIAVREVESWVMADRESFASFLGVSSKIIPTDTDHLPDAKQFLMSLVKRSRIRELRRSILPATGSTATQGPDYNGPLVGFIENQWRVREAAQYSLSLKRTLDVVSEFNQT
jgi:hypothetical protein